MIHSIQFKFHHTTILQQLSISKIPFDSSLTLLLLIRIDWGGLGYCTHYYLLVHLTQVHQIFFAGLLFSFDTTRLWLGRVPCPSIAAVFDLLLTTRLLHSNGDHDNCWWWFVLFNNYVSVGILSSRDPIIIFERSDYYSNFGWFYWW